MIPTISTSSLNIATVVDIGSYSLKIGESGDARPQHELYSCVATKEGTTLYGDSSLYNYNSRNIVQNGQVTDSEAFCQKIATLTNTNSQLFNCVSLLQPYFATAAERAQLADILFEKHGAKAVHFGSQEVSACLGAGVQTGCVVDMGFGVTKTVPVVDGRYLEGQVCYLNGEILSGFYVKEANPKEMTAFKKRVLAADLLQYCAKVSETALEQNFECRPEKYVMADGSEVEIKQSQMLLPECFFNTQLFDVYSAEQFRFNSVQYQFLQTIADKPAQVRREFVQNVVLCGGLSRINGLQNRLRAELEAVFGVQSLQGKPKFVQYAGDQRQLTFFGGSAIASLSVFGYLVTSAQEWREEGAAGLERRRM